MIEEDAYWWPPANRTHRSAGNLTRLDDDSLRLELDHHIVLWTVRNEVVWGETADSTPVTLLGCLVISSGKSTQELYVHVALIGAHIASANDAIFREVSVSLSNLTDWAKRGRNDLSLPEQITNPERPDEQLSLRG